MPTSALLTAGETLKLKIRYAEEGFVHADLFADETGFTPRPAWQVIEAARRQMLTGELSLATAPTTHVYLRDARCTSPSAPPTVGWAYDCSWKA
jgi:hypothetical protein